MNREEDVKDARLFDVRTVERNIKRGLITRKEYEKHLKSLGDVSEKIQPPEPEAQPEASPAAQD